MLLFAVKATPLDPKYWTNMEIPKMLVKHYCDCQASVFLFKNVLLGNVMLARKCFMKASFRMMHIVGN